MWLRSRIAATRPIGTAIAERQETLHLRVRVKRVLALVEQLFLCDAQLRDPVGVATV